MGNWNLYQTDVMLFCITFGILSLLVMFFFIRKIQLFRMGAYLLLAWSILAFLGVYFKINNYFGLKLVDGMLAKTLHLKWGWLVFFIGVFVVLFSVRKVKEIQ
ncbi:hypothetical protein [Sphingobacterium faecale]|nr:hypothetical protein [Sphingobacterium faecale]